MNLHEIAWRILTGNTDKENVDVRKVFCLFRIVMDPD